MTRFALGGWRLRPLPAGAALAPDALPDDGWVDAAGPSTAAAALRAAGLFGLDGPLRRFDAEDWWWRARADVAGAVVLRLGGLATLADVWWNGVHVLHSENMFLPHAVPLDDGRGELVIGCRSLDAALARKRPRPRWRAPMIENQQLRWLRTTLLGRTPGWSPPAAPVGPWRDVVLEQGGAAPARLRTRVEGRDGILECDGPLVLERDGREIRGAGRVVVPDVDLWWPHTHGEPARFRVRREDGHVLGWVGFRTVTVTTEGGDFAVSVNGVPVFCRGACWTPVDPVSLGGAPDGAVAQAAAAGMNMLRVSGTMVYESDAFYEACDAHGVLVWQDLMFANLDYPDDPAFVDLCRREVAAEVGRIAAHPSLALVCGGSEVEQQAAMWGAGRERWSPRLFHEILPAVVAEAAPGVPYWPSSAHGGAFPHAADAGTTSYYGVGAYLRPLDDARRAGVRFASECLAFANLPATGAPDRARTPRDLGASWDFDDVRDHYVRLLFGVDPAALRRSDFERYLALGRVASGEVMAATFAEWRRARSSCRGALVWFLRDLWPAAGWGVVAADGTPKPAWYALRRALAPTAIAMTDEGGNGLAIHVMNDGPRPLETVVTVSLFRAGEITVGDARRDIVVPAHGAVEIAAASLFDHFVDLSYAYRFGPPPCDLVVASLAGTDQAACHFPAGRPAGRELDVGLRATLDGDVLTVATRRFAQTVSIVADGFVPDDDFFDLAPGATRTVRLRGTGKLGGAVTALNAETSARFGAP